MESYSIFLSRDVIFHEYVFHFSSTSSLPTTTTDLIFLLLFLHLFLLLLLEDPWRIYNHLLSYRSIIAICSHPLPTPRTFLLSSKQFLSLSLFLIFSHMIDSLFLISPLLLPYLLKVNLNSFLKLLKIHVGVWLWIRNSYTWGQ